MMASLFAAALPDEASWCSAAWLAVVLALSCVGVDHEETMDSRFAGHDAGLGWRKRVLVRQVAEGIDPDPDGTVRGEIRFAG